MYPRVSPLLSAVVVATALSLVPDAASAKKKGSRSSKAKTVEVERETSRQQQSQRAVLLQRTIRPAAASQAPQSSLQRPTSVDIVLPPRTHQHQRGHQPRRAILRVDQHRYDAMIEFRPFRLGRKSYSGVRLILEGTADLATLDTEDLERALEKVAVAYNLPFAAAQLPDGRAVVAARPHRRHRRARRRR